MNIEYLLSMDKILKINDGRDFIIDDKNLIHEIQLISKDGKNNFILDLNKRKISIENCTYQTRFKKQIILARVDIVSQNDRHRNAKTNNYIWQSYTYIVKMSQIFYPLKDIFGEIDITDLNLVLNKFCNYININNSKCSF
jgi:hypothetical protein